MFSIIQKPLTKNIFHNTKPFTENIFHNTRFSYRKHFSEGISHPTIHSLSENIFRNTLTFFIFINKYINVHSHILIGCRKQMWRYKKQLPSRKSTRSAKYFNPDKFFLHPHTFFLHPHTKF